MPDRSSSQGSANGESRTRSLDSAPRDGSRVEQQIWAWRAYHGLAPGGRSVEERTQQEIADVLGFSRQIIDRWMNRETIAPDIVGGLTRRQRLLLYGMIVGGRTERACEYLTLLSLEERLTAGRDGPRVTST